VRAFIEDMESTVADHSGAEGLGVDAHGNVGVSTNKGYYYSGTLAPTATITAGPANSSVQPTATASFDFTTSAGASAECRLDTSAFVACATGVTYSGLAQGSHTFRVHSVDVPLLQIHEEQMPKKF